jgi:hypothetical protein
MNALDLIRSPALTAPLDDDRYLLARLNWWRRKTGTTFSYGAYDWKSRDGRVAVNWEEGEITVFRADGRGQFPTWGDRYRVESVRQAVDLLVALGVLPPEFATAYTAGWNDAMRQAVLAS